MKQTSTKLKGLMMVLLGVGLLGSVMLISSCGSKSSPTSSSSGTGTPTVSVPSVSTLCTFASVTPYYLAVDTQGNVYATTNGGTIVKCTSAGVTSTYKSGFTTTVGVAVDGSGNLYVSDSGAKTVSKITTGGVVSTRGGAFTFNTPYALTINSNATTLFISDTGTFQIDALVLGSNSASSYFGGLGDPYGIAVETNGDIYYSNGSFGDDLLIVYPAYASAFAGTNAAGFANGALTSAKFDDPLQVALDSSENIYLADNANDAIREISGSVVSTLVGSAAESPTVTKTLSSPTGVAVDGSGNVYFTSGSTIYKYQP
jgi:hypothetical protein